LTFSGLTGKGFDALVQSVGLRTWRLRYSLGNGTYREILPRPLITDTDRTSADAIPSPLTASEQLASYDVSVPEESLRNAIGGAWQQSIQPHARWQINKGQGWIDARLIGNTQPSGAGARYGFKLVEKGIGES